MIRTGTWSHIISHDFLDQNCVFMKKRNIKVLSFNVVLVYETHRLDLSCISLLDIDLSLGLKRLSDTHTHTNAHRISM